jgi:SAM-dependent methyltransferase
MQAWGWSAGYALFVVLASYAAVASLRGTQPAPTAAAVDIDTDEAAPTLARQVLWCTLAGTGSVLLLAITNYITQNIAAVPLLWIVPLTLYLLTFILCFDGRGWYKRDIMLAMLSAALGVMAWTLADPSLTHELQIQVGVFCVGLFLACMFCHGELVLLKPAPRYLTRFYLMISLGGALGAAVVGILAPLLLPADFELGGALVLCALLLLWQVRREPPVYGVLGLVAALVAIGCSIWGVVEFYDSTIYASRNFYGVLRVQQWGLTEEGQKRTLIHGSIMHGNQYTAPDLKRQPTSYYTQSSGIGRLLEALHPRKEPLRVGMIGLGTGTLATYGAKGDTYRIYDINPAVIDVAKKHFTYLADSDATIETPLGDARLTLEREAPQHFDVLAIDAFSSDAIPVHLITSEAIDVYLRHLKPDGVIAFHVTNRYLNLIPVVEALAHAHDLHALLIVDDGEANYASKSDWVLLSRNTGLLNRPELADHATPIEPRRDWRLWTDDFNNLVQVLK